MKRTILIIFFLLGTIFLAEAQEDDFSYVKVPAKFEFLNEENKFQLNALTAFLLEKHGYEAVYKENIPQGVSACDLLYTDVENNSGLFTTKLQVVLRDCEDRVVFISEEGKSREKDYKKAYHEALRDAFNSLEKAESVKEQFSDSQSTGLPERAEKRAFVQSEGVVENKPVSELAGNLPYSNGSQKYRLEMTDSGFDLFREGEDEKFASLLKSNSGDHYIYTSKTTQGSAFFNQDRDLLVEYVDENSGQLVTLRYRYDGQ